MTSEDQFTRDVKADLKRLVDSTSPQTRARLGQIVDAAIQGRGPARAPRRRVALTLGAVAASMVGVTAALLQWRDEAPSPSASQAPATPADDVALLLNMDDLDLLERMEFYRWLEQQPGILEGERGSRAVAPPRSSQSS